MRIGQSLIGRLGATASAAALAVALAGIPSWAVLAQTEGDTASEAEAEDAAAEEEEMPEFTAELLEDAEVIGVGEGIWEEQCRHCHGRAAYPGKAPKLRPSRYDPEFVYNRVTFGFRGMPGWQDVYSPEERAAVTAYVLSDEFSP